MPRTATISVRRDSCIPPCREGWEGQGDPHTPGPGLAMPWQTQRPFFSPSPVFAFLPAGPRRRPRRPAALPRNARNEAQQGCRPPHQPPMVPHPPTRPPRS